jgi:hypothetical protein
MKAPYVVMDNAKQKRQNNRQRLKHMNFNASPSKERLLQDANDLNSNNKRGSLPISSMYQTLEPHSARK